ncbi:Secretory carrier membrane protein [Corchorus olitorius]|uniref:Secretory carrier-associated membrane protein n=1 Tax=Corchorus olitorius TaxID=93759 RepID=A0A1R3J3D7_9ROSI|nr:Secretory carrier membrane protein [Corchorus olitorius]
MRTLASFLIVLIPRWFASFKPLAMVILLVNLPHLPPLQLQILLCYHRYGFSIKTNVPRRLNSLIAAVGNRFMFYRMITMNGLKCYTHLLASIPPVVGIGDSMLQHGELLRSVLMGGNLQYLSSTTGVFLDVKNWPPFFPIIHHDIANEIPDYLHRVQYTAFATFLGT